MKRIVLLTQKGGSGKTTLAIHLAVAAEQAGEKVYLVDTDPQESATTWAKQRQEKTPIVATVEPDELGDALHAAWLYGITFAVIDTAGQASPSALSAVQQADFILIPCRPTVLDVAAASRTVDMVKASGKPAAFILSQCHPRALEIPEVIEALSAYGIPSIPATIGFRLAFARALASGQAVTEFDAQGKAAQEIQTLYHWLKEHPL
jgi:chromosome partitioning protein